MLINIIYFLSGWIANLGVVPLFSFAFFLFAPAFFLFSFLLIRVCVVFEDIFHSLSYLNNNNSRQIYLSIIALLVKIFFPVLMTPIDAWAQKSDIFLSRGEQIELSTGKISHFSVGNQEVLKYKYIPSQGKILIKAKKLGFTDLVVWKNKRKKINYNFYITSKREQLKRMEIIKSLKETGLSINVIGGLIYVNGEIKDLRSYFILKKIETNKINEIILNVRISQRLKNEIIADIYQSLYATGIQYISCKEQKTVFFCQYTDGNSPSKLFKKLKEKYDIIFENTHSLNLYQNYKLQFYIIATVSNDATSLNSGINRIETKLETLISESRTNLKTDNIFLQTQKLKAKIVASPEIYLIPNNNFTLELGQETPYQVSHSQGEGQSFQTKWKFSGLRLSGKLSLQNNLFMLKYKSQLTETINESIQGPKSISSLILSPNKKQLLAKLDLAEYDSHKQMIPLLAALPLLGHFFKSHNANNSKKTIIIYAQLTQEKP